MAFVTNFNRAPKKKGIALAGTGAKKAYLTTAKAGFHVARMRMPGETKMVDGKATHAPKPGAVVWLSDLQAHYELNRGTIALMNPQPASASAEDVASAVAEQAPASTAPAAPAAPAS